MIDRELIRRAEMILRKLERLGDGQTTTLDPTSHGKPESQKPIGARDDPQDRVPRYRNLFEWWQRRIQEAIDAGDVYQLRFRTFLAERDYAEAVVYRDTGMRGPLYGGQERIGGAVNASHPAAERIDDEAFAERIVVEYEGVWAPEVAVLERVPTGWVEKFRERAERDAQTGLPGLQRPDFDTLNDTEKLNLIRGKQNEGWSQRAVKRHFGISHWQVRRYWEREAV